MSRKVILAGGTGYIGSHTCVELIQSGFEVVIADDLSNSGFEIVDRIKQITGVLPQFVHVNLADEKAANEFFRDHQDAKGIINFAALKAVGESVEHPISYYKNNLNIVLNILDNMSQWKIPNLIFSSSATVYGLPEILPITEGEKTKRPTSPYGNTKKMAEEIIEDYAKVSSTGNIISLRYFNPIGAHPSGLIGELPTGVPNNLMPFITQTAIGKREQLMVFGDDYYTPDGTAIRDYIHVVDLSKAHVIALNRLIDKHQNENFEIFNLGSGNGYSVLEVIKSFEKVSGEKLNYKITKRRDGDVPVLLASPENAELILGWKPELNLDEMTKSSWEWEVKLNK